jgi:hypothetical protein
VSDAFAQKIQSRHGGDMADDNAGAPVKHAATFHHLSSFACDEEGAFFLGQTTTTAATQVPTASVHQHV